MSLLLEQRQLTPVFEDLDAGRPKQAYETLLKLPKRHPKLSYSELYTPLRILCLQRLGEEDEAFSIFRELIKVEKDGKEKEKEKKSVSSGKGRAVKGKGGRQALLKQVQAKGGIPKQDTTTTGPVGVDDEKEEEADLERKVEEMEKKEVADEEEVPGRVFGDVAINILQYALKAMNKHRELRKIYHDAWNADNKKDLEKGAQAFMCSLWLRDWDNMQKTALQLLGLSQEPKMAHWAAMSLYLQATENSTPLEQKPLLLSLAHSLITNPPANPYRIPDVFILFLRICRLAGTTSTQLALQSSREKSSLTNGITAQSDSAKRLTIPGTRLEKEALEALTPDLRKSDKDAEVEAGWWTAIGNDLRIKWERWGMIEEIVGRLMGREDEVLSSLPASEGLTPNGKDEDVPEADEDTLDPDEQDEVEAEKAVAARSDESVGEVDWVKGWDWEKEWVRADDILRGVEDVPETNYQAYLTYTSVLFLLLSRPETIKSSRSTSDYLKDARETLLDLADKPNFKAKERAPLLALLEINKRLKNLGLKIELTVPESKVGDVVLILRYLEEFGHKGCVRDDLAPHWERLSAEDRETIFTTLNERSAGGHNDVKSYSSKLNADKLLRSFSPAPDKEQEKQLGKKYLGLYFDGAPYGKDLPETDVRPADDYATMAAQAWIRVWYLDQQDKDARAYLLLAAFVLSKLVEDSPANGSARMLLIRVYRLMGAPSLVPAQIPPLKMRSFQQDTALHFVTERATIDYLAGGDAARQSITGLLLECKKVQERTEDDVGSGVADAFNRQSYSQVPSMFELGQKFRTSHQRQLGELELIRHSALRDTKELATDRNIIIQNLDVLDLESVTDVRDWDLFVDFGPSGEPGVLKQTELGLLSTPQSIRALADAWKLALSMEHESQRDVEVDNGLTQPEITFLAFSRKLSAVTQGYRDGQAQDTQALLNYAKAVADSPQSVIGWESIHRAVVLLEMYAIAEISLGALKPKGGKKGKKTAAIDGEATVGESVSALFKGLQDVIRDYAAAFKANESTDSLLVQNIGIDQLKRIGVVEMFEVSSVRSFEQAVRDSRQSATKEVYRELKRRSDG